MTASARPRVFRRSAKGYWSIGRNVVDPRATAFGKIVDPELIGERRTFREVRLDQASGVEGEDVLGPVPI